MLLTQLHQWKVNKAYMANISKYQHTWIQGKTAAGGVAVTRQQQPGGYGGGGCHTTSEVKPAQLTPTTHTKADTTILQVQYTVETLCTDEGHIKFEQVILLLMRLLRATACILLRERELLKKCHLEGKTLPFFFCFRQLQVNHNLL